MCNCDGILTERKFQLNCTSCQLETAIVNCLIDFLIHQLSLWPQPLPLNQSIIQSLHQRIVKTKNHQWAHQSALPTHWMSRCQSIAGQIQRAANDINVIKSTVLGSSNRFQLAPFMVTSLIITIGWGNSFST